MSLDTTPRAEEIQMQKAMVQVAEASLTYRVAPGDKRAAESATTQLKMLNAQIKKSKDVEKETLRPFKEGVKALSDRFKAYRAPIESAIAHLRGELLAHQQFENEEKRKREEAEKAARLKAALESAEKLEEAGQEEQAEKVLKKELARPVDTTAAKTRGDYGGVALTRRVIKWRVANLREVPSNFLSSDEKKLRMACDSNAIKAAIKNGSRTIPGLEIYEEDELCVR